MATAKEKPKKYFTRKSDEMVCDGADDILESKFTNFKQQLIADFERIIDERITELANHLFERVDDLERNVSNNNKKILENSKKVKELEDKADCLKKHNKSLQTKIEAQEKTICDLQESFEDQINRNARKTLIFTNVPETSDETYDVSPTLANTICKATNGEITIEKAKAMVERAHRGKARRNSKGGPRPIYAAIDDWRNSEKVKDLFLDKKNKSGIYCQQMFGPRTTWRRSQALKMRKELKDQDPRTKGYVAFPARLMVKKQGDTKYHLYRDFSNVPVVFGK